MITKSSLVPKKAGFTVLFVCWVLLITGLSLFDLSSDGDGIEIPHLDKLAHFTFYFVFVLLGWHAIKHRELNPKPAKYRLILMGLATGYGLLMEGLQNVLPVDRSAEILDVLANTLGAVSGYLLIKVPISPTNTLK